MKRRRAMKLFGLAALTPLFASCGQAQTGAGTVDINEMGPNNQHMIFWRIQQRDFEAVTAFLDAGVDVNIRGFNGTTPAIWAASSDGWRFVEMFAERGADLSLSSRSGVTVARVVQLADDVGRVRAGTDEAQALDLVRARLQRQGLLP